MLPTISPTETNPIIQVLMTRDEMSFADACDVFQAACDDIQEGCDPEEVLADHFGLEPDYIFDIVGF